MKLRLICTTLAAGMLSSGIQAADLTVVNRTQVIAPAQAERAIVRLANQGLGYSVLHQAVGLSQQSYRVHVTCAIDESFVQTYCPTPAYEAYCPNAQIVCR